MSDLMDILNERAKDVEQPKPLPAGVYHGVVDVTGGAPWVEVTASSTGTKGMQFTIRLIAPVKVSDEAALQAAGGCAGRTVKQTFYVTDNNKFFVKQFLVDHLGLEEGDKTIGQLASEAGGRECGVVLRNTLSKGQDPRMIHIVDSIVRL